MADSKDTTLPTIDPRKLRQAVQDMQSQLYAATAAHEQDLAVRLALASCIRDLQRFEQRLSTLEQNGTLAPVGHEPRGRGRRRTRQ